MRRRRRAAAALQYYEMRLDVVYDCEISTKPRPLPTSLQWSSISGGLTECRYPPAAVTASPAMLIIPAIDLKDGKCVRLKQGVMEDATVFSEDPGATAAHWLAQGARRLHVVDLNGAAAGRPKNEQAIKAITAAVGEKIPVQLGGGIRDLDTIERYLDAGVSYVIIGTAAVKTPGFLHDACSAFTGHVMVALDAKHGKVAVHAWY